MNNDTRPPLRSVALDGSTRGRIDGNPFDLRVSPDGASAEVWLEAEAGRTARVLRCSLDDGTITPRGLPRDARLRRPHSRFSTISRSFAAVPAELPDRVAWYDGDGRGGEIPLAPSEALLDVSDDAQRVVIGRPIRGYVEALRVVRVDDGATLYTLRCPPLVSASVRLHGRFIFAAATSVVTEGLGPGADPLVRVRLDDGTFVSVRNPSSNGGLWTMERGGERVAIALPGRVAVYDLDTLQVVASFASPFPTLEDFVNGVLLVRDTGVNQRPLSRMDLASGEALTLPVTPRARLPRLTPDGGRVVFLRQALVCAYDIAAGRHLAFHDGPDAYAQHTTWSQGGEFLASVGFDGAIRVLDARRGALAWTFEGAPSMFDDHSPTTLAFAPDGRQLYAMSARAIFTWSLVTGEEIARSPCDGTMVCAAAVSPDGRLLAVFAIEDQAPVVVVRDISASMRRVARHPIGRFHDLNGLRLTIDAAGRPALFVRHWQHAGQAALLGVDDHGRLAPIARRSLRQSAQVVPLDHADALHLDRGALSTVHLSGRERSEARSGPGFTLESLLDARADVAAFLVRDAEGAALALTDLRGERVLGFVRNERAVIGGVLSPDGKRLAVRYAATGLEVFER